MRDGWEDITHGTIATSIVTIAGVEDFAVRLASAVIVAVVSAVVVHFVRRHLRKRDWARWGREHNNRDR